MVSLPKCIEDYMKECNISDIKSICTDDFVEYVHTKKCIKDYSEEDNSKKNGNVEENDSSEDDNKEDNNVEEDDNVEEEDNVYKKLLNKKIEELVNKKFSEMMKEYVLTKRIKPIPVCSKPEYDLSNFNPKIFKFYSTNGEILYIQFNNNMMHIYTHITFNNKYSGKYINHFISPRSFTEYIYKHQIYDLLEIKYVNMGNINIYGIQYNAYMSIYEKKCNIYESQWDITKITELIYVKYTIEPADDEDFYVSACTNPYNLNMLFCYEKNKYNRYVWVPINMNLIDIDKSIDYDKYIKQFYGIC